MIRLSHSIVASLLVLASVWLHADPPPAGAGRMLQQPDRLRVAWMLKETLLPAPLIAPGPLEQHRIHRLKKNCGAGVGRIAVRI